MTSPLLDPSDLEPFANITEDKAVLMIEDAQALATLVAPCLVDPTLLTEAQLSAFKALLRTAILRWNEAGSGALSQRSETVGPYNSSQSIDTRQQRRGMFWPSEIEQMQTICGKAGRSNAFSIDTTPSRVTVHADVCALAFGALYCSCAADIAGFPLYETNGQ